MTPKSKPFLRDIRLWPLGGRPGLCEVTVVTSGCPCLEGMAGRGEWRWVLGRPENFWVAVGYPADREQFGLVACGVAEALSRLQTSKDRVTWTVDGVPASGSPSQ